MGGKYSYKMYKILKYCSSSLFSAEIGTLERTQMSHTIRRLVALM